MTNFIKKVGLFYGADGLCYCKDQNKKQFEELHKILGEPLDSEALKGVVMNLAHTSVNPGYSQKLPDQQKKLEYEQHQVKNNVKGGITGIVQDSLKNKVFIESEKDQLLNGGVYDKENNKQQSGMQSTQCPDTLEPYGPMSAGFFSTHDQLTKKPMEISVFPQNNIPNKVGNLSQQLPVSPNKSTQNEQGTYAGNFSNLPDGQTNQFYSQFNKTQSQLGNEAQCFPGLSNTITKVIDETKYEQFPIKSGIYLPGSQNWPGHDQIKLPVQTDIKLDTLIVGTPGLSAKYPSVMPINYYMDVINKEMNRGQNEKWYTKNIHLESLTEHPFSLRDNILDTNYVGYLKEFDRDINGPIYDPKDLPTKKPSDAKDMLVNNLEEQIQMLKSEITQIQNKPQQPVLPNHRTYSQIPDRRLEPEYNREYYRSINHKMPYETMRTTCEAILGELRNDEKQIVNNARQTVYETKKDPVSNWYEIKDDTFIPEMKRYLQQQDRTQADEAFLRKLKYTEIF